MELEYESKAQRDADKLRRANEMEAHMGLHDHIIALESERDALRAEVEVLRRALAELAGRVADSAGRVYCFSCVLWPRDASHCTQARKECVEAVTARAISEARKA